MTITIHRNDDRVWLEGVQGWFVGDKESSSHAAQEAIMQALGEKIDYTTLVGVSGLAFRMQVSKEGLCPSSPHPACGFQCLERSNMALPWDLQFYSIRPNDSDDVLQVRQVVLESIEHGVPVQYGSEEDGVVIGYQKGGEEWLCLHPYREGGKTMFVEPNLPWGVAIFTGRKTQPTNLKKLALGALQQALHMAHDEQAGGYFVGTKAWEVYLEKLEALQLANDDSRQESMLGNAWIYECLVQFRRTAATYLRGLAGEFSSPAAAHLHKAASLYTEMTESILCNEEQCFTTIAPYPWLLKEGQRWSPDMIQEQIKRLMETEPLEHEALHDLEQALALIDALPVRML